MEIPSTHILCMFPIIQQVIGLGTILSNVVKAIYDIAQAVLSQTWKGGVDLYEERDKFLDNPDELEKFDQKFFDLPGYQFEQHLVYICIGIIRAIPIVGTLYSIGVHVKYLSAKMVIDDPRPAGVAIKIKA